MECLLITMTYVETKIEITIMHATTGYALLQESIISI